MFERPTYNTFRSASYAAAMAYLSQLKGISSVLDIGAGHGSLVQHLVGKGGLEVIACDLDNYLAEDIKANNFIKVDLTNAKDRNKLPQTDALFCLDVLEHIEEKYINRILQKFSKLSRNCFFSIANHSDVIEGIELHLIQQPQEYWEKKLEKYYEVNKVNQLYNDTLILFELTSRNCG